MRVFTVGHGAKSSEEFLETLRGAAVETLVDVRRYPSSRWHPQFNRAALEVTVRAAGLEYVHEVELGGKRKAEPGEQRFRCLGEFQAYAVQMTSQEWQDALERALGRPAPCFMCAETHWRKCHRRFISELLTARGHEVIHLLRGQDAEPHQPMLEAEGREGRLYLCGDLVS